MSAKYSDQKIIKIMVMVVGLLALPTLWSWFSPTSALITGVSAGAKAVRGIASIPAESNESKNGKFSRPVTMEWDPSKPAFQKEVDGTHLRLKGILKDARLPSITNQTNGFTAAVFSMDAGFSTDFIELSEGTNEIKVEGTDGKGRKVTRILQVTRAPAAAVGP